MTLLLRESFLIKYATVFLLMLQAAPKIQAFIKKCPTKNGNFPLPGSQCTSYYQCENWIVVTEKTCRENQHFNAIEGFCDWKENYPCLEETKSKECPRPNGRFLKPETGCEKYYDCCNGKPKEKTCPEGELFDRDRQICDWETLVICKEGLKTKECPRPNGRFLKPGTECKKYFDCSNGKPKEKTCRNRKLFDASKGKCVRDELITCEEAKSSKESSSSESNESGSEEIISEPTSSTLFKTSALISTSIFSQSTSDESSNELTTDEIFSTQTRLPDMTTKSTSEVYTIEEISSSFSPRELSTSGDIFSPTQTNPSTLKEVSRETTTQPKDFFSIPTEETRVTNLTVQSTVEPTSVTTPRSTIYQETSSQITPQKNFTTEQTTIADIYTQATLTEISRNLTSRTSLDETTETSPDLTTDLTVQSTVEPTSVTTHRSTIYQEISSDITPQKNFTTEQITVADIYTRATSTEISQNLTSRTSLDETTETSLDLTTETSLDLTITQDQTTETAQELSSVNSVSTTGNIIETVQTTPIDLGTIDPTADFECPEPTGYYPHPTDKHKFIGCVHNRPSVLSCPSNLVYNDKQKRCTYQ